VIWGNDPTSGCNFGQQVQNGCETLLLQFEGAWCGAGTWQFRTRAVGRWTNGKRCRSCLMTPCVSASISFNQAPPTSSWLCRALAMATLCTVNRSPHPLKVLYYYCFLSPAAVVKIQSAKNIKLKSKVRMTRGPVLHRQKQSSRVLKPNWNAVWWLYYCCYYYYYYFIFLYIYIVLGIIDPRA